MGTLLAVKKGDELAIGADSFNLIDPQIRSPYFLSPGCIVEFGGSYIGLSSSLAYQHAFEAALKNLDQRKTPSLVDTAGVYEFFLRMHEILRNHYGMYINFQQGQEFEWSPMNALLINQSGIYKIDSSRSVSKHASLVAIGTGKDIAIGAASALQTSRKSATQIIAAAFEVTASYEALQSEDVTIKTIKHPPLKVTTGKASAKKRRSSSKKKSLKPVKGGKK